MFYTYDIVLAGYANRQTFKGAQTSMTCATGLLVEIISTYKTLIRWLQVADQYNKRLDLYALKTTKKKKCL